MATIRTHSEPAPINPDRANRAIWKFFWAALAVIVGIGIIWFVASAMNDPASRSDATAVGNAVSTTPGQTTGQTLELTP